MRGTGIDLGEIIGLLRRTPAVIRALLEGLPERYLRRNEGGETWSPFDVLGHLIHGERTDWIPRARIILDEGETRTFDPFDRYAQFEASKGKTVEELLDEFEVLRRRNLLALEQMHLSPEDLSKTGQHPELGRVTLGELLATWAAHDLDHLVQISRTLAKQYEDAVGPWQKYMSVLNSSAPPRQNR
jgi:hypothetical protein